MLRDEELDGKVEAVSILGDVMGEEVFSVKYLLDRGCGGCT